MADDDALVEAGARAMCTADYHRIEEPAKSDYIEAQWPTYSSRARAVIAAVRPLIVAEERGRLVELVDNCGDGIWDTGDRRAAAGKSTRWHEAKYAAARAIAAAIRQGPLDEGER